MNRALAALALLGAGFASCSPGSGTSRLEARTGQVVDTASGAPVAGAEVFQVYWGRGVAGEPRPARLLRWANADEAGGFAFDEQLSAEPRTWLLETDPPEYGFFHPRYGLVRAGPASGEGPLTLRGVPLDEARRTAERLALCGSRPADAVVAAVAGSHCSRRARE